MLGPFLEPAKVAHSSFPESRELQCANNWDLQLNVMWPIANICMCLVKTRSMWKALPIGHSIVDMSKSMLWVYRILYLVPMLSWICRVFYILSNKYSNNSQKKIKKNWYLQVDNKVCKITSVILTSQSGYPEHRTCLPCKMQQQAWEDSVFIWCRQVEIHENYWVCYWSTLPRDRVVARVDRVVESFNSRENVLLSYTRVAKAQTYGENGSLLRCNSSHI